MKRDTATGCCNGRTLATGWLAARHPVQCADGHARPRWYGEHTMNPLRGTMSSVHRFRVRSQAGCLSADTQLGAGAAVRRNRWAPGRGHCIVGGATGYGAGLYLALRAQPRGRGLRALAANHEPTSGPPLKIVPPRAFFFSLFLVSLRRLGKWCEFPFPAVAPCGLEVLSVW